jgi:hypothetical protein
VSSARGLPVFFILALCIAAPALAQSPRDAEGGRYVIHLLNIEVGDELFMRFGHIALLVEDRHKKKELVYNFGTFDFSDPDLRIKYAKGFLNYWLSVVPYAVLLPFYIEQERTLMQRTLNLTDAQAAEVAERLAINARPENREYAYRHYIDNCCTRIRDLLDDVMDGAIKKKYDKHPTGRTYRDWTRRALRGMPILSNIILFSLGPTIDHPITRWQEEFLPEVLAQDLDNLRIGPDRRPAVLKKSYIFESQAPPVGEKTPRLDIAVLGLLLMLLILGLVLPTALGSRAGSVRLVGMGITLFGLLSGLAGLMLILYWTATTHYDTHHNENLLIMPPLNLWLVGPGTRLLFKGRLSPRTATWLKGYLLFAVGLIAVDLLLKIGPFIQGNLEFIALSAVCNVAAIFALKRSGVILSLFRDKKTL